MSELKYQDLIEERGLPDCPKNTCEEKKQESYRLVHDPIDHDIDFLPNHVYDRTVLKKVKKYKSDDDCKRCGISLLTTIERANRILKVYSKKSSNDLGYTHVAIGEISNEHGICSDIENDHFTLYEYESSDLNSVFTIVEE